MSTDLVLPNSLASGTPQIVQDQDGGQSSLFLGANPGGGQSGFVGIVGNGGQGASAGLAISTYPELNQFTPNVGITAIDNGDFSANLLFNLQQANTQGSPVFTTVLVLLPTGAIQMPNLPQPVGGSVDLVVDSLGNVARQNSSVRFKEDVQPLQDDFHKVLALEPRSFAYKETGARGIGYTAEEVAAADLQNLVAYDTEGKPMGVHYKMLSVYLLELVKEQQAALAEVKAEIAVLKGEPS